MTQLKNKSKSVWQGVALPPRLRRESPRSALHALTRIKAVVRHTRIRGLGSEAPQGAKRKPKASGKLAAEGEAFPLPNRAVGAICGRYGKP